MSVELIDAAEVIRMAVNREELSARTYEQAQAVVRDPAAQAVLGRMRNEELRHRKLLLEVERSGEIERLGRPQLSGKLAKPELGDERGLGPDSGPRDVLLFALHHEERAVGFYGRYLEAFRDTPLGELFGRLKREEESHREQLEIMLSKLSGKP